MTLSFTDPAPTIGGPSEFELDNISFSPTATPEPNTLALIVMGGAAFAVDNGGSMAKNHAPELPAGSGDFDRDEALILSLKRFPFRVKALDNQLDLLIHRLDLDATDEGEPVSGLFIFGVISKMCSTACPHERFVRLRWRRSKECSFVLRKALSCPRCHLGTFSRCSAWALSPFTFRVVFVLRIERLRQDLIAGRVGGRVGCESVAFALSGAARPHCDCLPRLDPQSIARFVGFGAFLASA